MQAAKVPFTLLFLQKEYCTKANTQEPYFYSNPMSSWDRKGSLGARRLDYSLKILYGRLPPSLKRGLRAVNLLTPFNTSFFSLYHYFPFEHTLQVEDADVMG